MPHLGCFWRRQHLLALTAQPAQNWQLEVTGELCSHVFTQPLPPCHPSIPLPQPLDTHWGCCKAILLNWDLREAVPLLKSALF